MVREPSYTYMTVSAGCRGGGAEEAATPEAAGPSLEIVHGGAAEEMDTAMREEYREEERAAKAAEESRLDPGAGAPAEGGKKSAHQGLDRLPGHSGGLDAPVKPLSRRKQKLKEHCKLKKMKAKGIAVPGARLRLLCGPVPRT